MIQFDPEKFNKHRALHFRAKLILQIPISLLIIWGGQFFGVDLVYSSGIALFWICLVVWVYTFSTEGKKFPDLRLLTNGDPVLEHLSEPFRKRVKILIGPRSEKKRWSLSAGARKFVMLEDKFIEGLTPIQTAKLAALTFHTRLTDESTIGHSLLNSQLSLTCMAFLLFASVHSSSATAAIYIAMLMSMWIISFCFLLFSNAVKEAKTPEDIQALRDVLSKLEEQRSTMPTIFPLTRWSKFKLFLARQYVNHAAANVAKNSS